MKTVFTSILCADDWARHTVVFIVVCFAAFCLSPLGISIFESSMLNHMLVQLPLLGVAGALLLPERGVVNDWLLRIDGSGLITLIVGSGWMLFWMLPVSLDLATIETSYRVLKVLSVPLGIGLCLRWTWRRSGPVLRILVLFEGWASIARLGWIFVESPAQLCSSYLVGEQQAVGEILLMVSAVTGTGALAWGFLGSFGESQPTQSVEPD